jgi:hypothetical protein
MRHHRAEDRAVRRGEDRTVRRTEDRTARRAYLHVPPTETA